MIRRIFIKKVLQFVSTNKLSGLENVVLNISLLLRHQYSFIYVSPNGSINYYLHKYHIKHISVDKLTPFSVRSVIRQCHPNVVHGHDVKASLYLAMNHHLCSKQGIKIVSELHNDDPRMWRYSLRSILYLLSSPFYDRIIVISQSVINHFIFKNEIKNKVSIIENIVNPFRINQFSSYPKKWDCIFLGRFVNQKNPLKFVKIVYKLKSVDNNIKTIMLGDGVLMPEVRKMIRTYHLTNNIKLCGFQKNPYKYLYKSKVLVMPSKYEGFGLVALESLICGIPVVASFTGGLCKIVNDKCGAFATSVSDFYKSILKIISNTSIYKIKSINAKKHGNNINNLNNFISSYNKIYH